MCRQDHVNIIFLSPWKSFKFDSLGVSVFNKKPYTMATLPFSGRRFKQDLSNFIGWWPLLKQCPLVVFTCTTIMLLVLIWCHEEQNYKWNDFFLDIFENFCFVFFWFISFLIFYVQFEWMVWPITCVCVYFIFNSA